MPERARILLVEDDDDLRRMLSVTLGRLAHVHTARDGEEALTWLRTSPAPDVIVSDVMMPRVGGIELARALKHDQRLSGIPLVLLSAATDPKTVVTGINAGARQYLTKPFKSADLESRVKKLLALRAGEKVAGAGAEPERTVASDVSLDELPFDLDIDVVPFDEMTSTG